MLSSGEYGGRSRKETSNSCDRCFNAPLSCTRALSKTKTIGLWVGPQFETNYAMICHKKKEMSSALLVVSFNMRPKGCRCEQATVNFKDLPLGGWYTTLLSEIGNQEFLLVEC